MRLSRRDLLLMIGIVVAVVATLTTLVYREQVSAKQAGLPQKTSLRSTTHKLIDFVIGRVDTQKIL